MIHFSFGFLSGFVTACVCVAIGLLVLVWKGGAWK